VFCDYPNLSSLRCHYPFHYVHISHNSTYYDYNVRLYSNVMGPGLTVWGVFAKQPTHDRYVITLITSPD